VLLLLINSHCTQNTAVGKDKKCTSFAESEPNILDSTLRPVMQES
jgi:hypothetical protein